MKRLSRPLLFTSIAVAAIVTFVAAGSWAATPIDVTDMSGWLRAADPVDALAELARVAGLLLAVYVALVSAAALVAEVASILRMPRLAQRHASDGPPVRRPCTPQASARGRRRRHGDRFVATRGAGRRCGGSTRRRRRRVAGCLASLGHTSRAARRRVHRIRPAVNRRHRRADGGRQLHRPARRHPVGHRRTALRTRRLGVAQQGAGSEPCHSRPERHPRRMDPRPSGPGRRRDRAMDRRRTGRGAGTPDPPSVESSWAVVTVQRGRHAVGHRRPTTTAVPRPSSSGRPWPPTQTSTTPT